MKYSRLILVAVAAISAAVLVGCGEQKAAPASVAERPKFGIAAMSDEDKAYFAFSFTTLGTVPYGKIMPESLFNNLLCGQKLQEGQQFVAFGAPEKGMKQNAKYPEWLRVKKLMVEVPTRRIVGARGCAGPFANEAAVQSYLDSEIRPNLNGQLYVTKVVETDDGEAIEVLCESNFRTEYSLRISLDPVSTNEFWIDALTTLK